MLAFAFKFKYEPSDGFIVVNGTISIFEILSLLGFIFVVISLILAVRAAIEHARTRRAEFSFRVWQAFMQEEVQAAYLEIEWGRFRYPATDTSVFASNEQERGIDRLLYLFDELALLAKTKVLSKADIERWSYQGQRVFNDESILRYLNVLDDIFEGRGIKRKPHELAREVFGNGLG